MEDDFEYAVNVIILETPLDFVSGFDFVLLSELFRHDKERFGMKSLDAGNLLKWALSVTQPTEQSGRCRYT